MYASAGMNGHPALRFVGDVTSANTMSIADWATALNGKTEYTLFMVSTISAAQGQNVPVVLTAPYAAQGWTWLVEYDLNGGMFWGHGGYRRYDSGIVQDAPYLFTFHYLPAEHIFTPTLLRSPASLFMGGILRRWCRPVVRMLS